MKSDEVYTFTSHSHYLSIFIQAYSQHVVLYLHVEHIQGQEVYNLAVKDSIMIKSQDGSIYHLSPKGIYKHLIANGNSGFQLSSNEDLIVQFKINNEVQKYSFKLIKNQNQNIWEQARYKKLKQNYLQTMKHFQSKMILYQRRIQQLQKKVGIQNKEQLLPIYQAQSPKKNHRQSSEIIDSQMEKIISKMTNEQNTHQNDIKQLNQQIRYMRQSIEKNKDFEAKISQIDIQHQNQLKKVHQRIDQLSKYNTKSSQRPQDLQNKVNQILNKRNHLFISHAQSQSEIEIEKLATGGATIKNKEKPQGRQHNFYFSKLALKKGSITSIKFHTNDDDEKEWLFGICSQNCLKNQQIYKDKQSIFINHQGNIFINTSFVNADNSIIQQNHLKEIIMQVNLVQWRISWKIEGEVYKALNLPQEIRSLQCHPAILFTEQNQQVEIDYY